MSLKRRPKDRYSDEFARAIVLNGFRDTVLENIHSGEDPVSRTGDFSDVKVVTPDGEIPWTKVSRITQAEMKELIIEAFNVTYTALTNMTNIPFVEGFAKSAMNETRSWNPPEIDEALVARFEAVGRKILSGR